MKRMTAMLSVAAVALWAVGVMAQAKPNFAGSWVMEPAAAPAGAPAGAPGGGGGGGGRGGGRGGGGGWGMEITVTQDANTLTVDGMAGGQPQKFLFKLDGSESKNSVMGRGGQPTDQMSKAAWTGTTLTITTTTQGQNGPTETKRVLSLEGGNLVISTTAPGFGGGDPMTTKTTYKKK